MGSADHHPPPLSMTAVSVIRSGKRVLDAVTFEVGAGQRWVVFGANGSGKTTLTRIAALYDHPTSGTVTVLGDTLGSCDIRRLRQRVGYLSAAFTSQVRSDLTASDVVMTARYAALEPWWHHYTDADRVQARSCLDRLGVGALAERRLATLSSGEQQRVFLARTLMNDPEIIILDEPSARLDLSGREQLVATLDEFAASGPPFVLVTHHLEEVPTHVSHALLLRDGQVVAAGPIADALTDDTLSTCFGMALRIERRSDGRFTAWGA